MLTSLLVTGVVGALVAMLLGPVFGYSTRAGYHRGNGSLTTKGNATLLRLMKIAAAGVIAALVAPTILAASPFVIGATAIGGVLLLLHTEIDNWRFI